MRKATIIKIYICLYLYIFINTRNISRMLYITWTFGTAIGVSAQKGTRAGYHYSHFDRFLLTISTRHSAVQFLIMQNDVVCMYGSHMSMLYFKLTDLFENFEISCYVISDETVSIDRLNLTLGINVETMKARNYCHLGSA